MLFRSGKNWVVDFFLRRGWLARRRLKPRRRPGNWNPLSTVPAQCLEQRILLSTITVTTLDDNLTSDGLVTLREAIEAANTDASVDGSTAGESGVQDQIVFSPGLNGTISLDSGLGQLTITSSLKIQGLGTGNTIIDAQHNSRIFSIDGSAGDVEFDGLTLENGKTTAAGRTSAGGAGGAIFSAATGTLTLSDDVLSGNSTTGNQASGGAVFADGPVTVINSSVSGNSTSGPNAAYGGAIYSAGAVTVVASTLSGNSTSGIHSYGGALFTFGDIQLTNSTVTGNSTTGSGSNAGAIWTGSALTATNSTIAQNSAVNGQGGGVYQWIFNPNSTITLKNTIVAQNTDNGTAPDLEIIGGATVTMTHSLIGSNVGTGRTEAPVGSPDANGNLIGGPIHGLIDPQLGALADNGGPTQTMALLAGSPAIGTGDNTAAISAGLTTDQRGAPYYRIAGAAVDMGAFESQTLSLVVTSTADLLHTTYDPANETLRDALYIASHLSGHDTITFDPSLNGTPIMLSLGEMVITDSVTITGNGSANTIVDAQQNSRIFNITSSAADVTLDGLTLEDGQTTGDLESGAAIQTLSSGTLTIRNSTLTGNTTVGAGATGGAISNAGGILLITGSSLSGNTTAGKGSSGGAVYNATGIVAITNSTLTGNGTASVEANGGAVYSYAGRLTLINATVAANQATSGAGGGIGVGPTASLTVRNTILAQNTDGGTAPDLYYVSGATVVITHSLLGDNTGTGLAVSATPNGDGNLIGATGALIDPLLGPLDFHGGTTQTMVLGASSPALNKGAGSGAFDPGPDGIPGNGDDTSLATDQRGAPFVRSFGASVDMGAYETQSLSLVVNSTDDVLDAAFNAAHITLRDALALANANPGLDAITFAPAINGTPIVVTAGQMDILDTVTIAGNGTANTILDAQQNSRIFSIGASAGDVTLSGMTLENGKASSSGGAILSSSPGLLTISSSAITNSTVTGNHVAGGAIADTGGPVTIIDSTLTGNTTTGQFAGGGAVYTYTGDVTISGSTLSGNYTKNNYSPGGAVSTQHGQVTLTNSTLSGNSTGGKYSQGGAVYARFGAVTLTGSTLSGNSTALNFARGGAVSSGDVVTVVSSTLSGNSTAGNSAVGGAINAFDGVKVTNSTITGNSTAGTGANGGAVFAFHGNVTAVNSTIAQNHATNATGGGVSAYYFTGTVTLTNTILAQNTDGGTAPDLRIKPFQSLTVSHSLIGDNTGTTLTPAPVGSPDGNGNLIGTAGALIDPLLGTLNDNGGPTQTMALLALSPALDAGNSAEAIDPDTSTPLSTDQRGAPFARQFGAAVDMGAYEKQVFSIVVNSADDVLDATYDPAHVTLRDAIALSNVNPGNDAITFDAALDGTPIVITNGQMTIRDTVTITGNGAANTILDAQQNSRVFRITALAGDVTLSDMALTNGKTSGYFGRYGGAIRSDSAGMLTIVRSALTNNSTTGDYAPGGAISASNGSVTITDSVLTGNSTAGFYSFGGAVAAGFGVTITGSTISGNFTLGAYASGGAIYNRFGGLTITGSILSGNSTADDDAAGGAVASIAGTVTVSGTTLSGNSTGGRFSDGGAIYSKFGAVTVTDSTVSENATALGESRGGAISAGNDVTVTSSTISGNSTAGFKAIGGGIAAYGAVIVTNSTISGNSTSGTAADGGAIYSYLGIVTAVNSTIVQNHATNAIGGGVYAYLYTGTVTLTNTILAQNTDAGTAPDLAVGASAAVTVTHSLIGDNTGTTLPAAPVGFPDSNGNLIGTSGATIDPLLGPLNFNGGTTKTMALLAGSPALDAGSTADAVDPNTSAPLSTDQRGAPFARSFGAAVDMGAFERQTLALTLVVNSTDDTLDPGYNPSHLTLRDAVALADGNAGPDTITFDPAIDGQTIFLTLGELFITEDVTITGNGSVNTIVDAQHNSRVLHIASGVTASLGGLTITGGSVTGPLIADTGGGIVNQGALMVSDSVITGNAAGRAGGGIMNYGATSLSLINCTISNNTAAYGAGIYGGGTGTFSAANCTITGNIASLGGGGLAGNIATSIVDCTIDGNSAQFGAGIFANIGTWTIKGSTVSNNQAGSSGGGVYDASANLIVINSTVSGNTAPTGGGLYFQAAFGSTYNCVLNDVTISNNRATTGTTAGGGVFVQVGVGPLITHLLTLQNTIVAGNFGGAAGTAAADVAGPLEAASAVNFVGDGSNMTGISNGASGNQVGTFASPIDAHLGALANNGGPTQTMALLTGSPAVAAGAIFNDLSSNPITVDQRGKARFTGAVDIGAYQSVTVGSITRKTPATSPTNATSVTFTVTFNEPVQNVTAGAFSVNAGSVNSPVQVNSSTYDITVSGLGAFNGTLTLSFAPGQAITDVAGNPLVNTIPTGTDVNTYDLDHVAPATNSFTRQTPATSPTNASSLVFRATFSKAVTNVDTTDFQVNGTTTATVTNVAAVGGSGGTQYDVTVSGGNLATFNGVVGIDLKSGQNITDLVGNALPTVEPATDDTYTLDHVAPATNSFARQSPTLFATNANALVFRATFSEAVTNVDTTDFQVHGATTATITIVAPVGGSGGTQYDVTVSGGNLATFNGVVGIDLKSGQNITDLAGNALPTTEPAIDKTYTVDHDPPASFAFAGEYSVATVGNSTLTLASIIQNGANLTLNGSSSQAATVLSPTQIQVGATTATYADSQIVFGATGPFANQTWTKINLPPNFTNVQGNATHVIQNGSGITFVDKFGGNSVGTWLSPTQLSAFGETVTITHGKLAWSDGSFWYENLVLTGLGNGVPTTMVVSVPSEFTVLDYNNGHGAIVHVIETGSSKVIFNDGLGHFSLGSFINLTQALSDAYPNDRATFSGDASVITWQDGYVWTRIAPTNQITLTDYTNTNGVTAHVIRNGSSQVVFSDSKGDLSIGTFINATQVTTPRYPGDVATLGVNTLSWLLDGQVWTKLSAPPPPLLITATNPAGGVSRLGLVTRVTLIGLDGPLQGVNGVRLNGKIFWENGDVWTGFDFGGLNALFVVGIG